MVVSVRIPGTTGYRRHSSIGMAFKINEKVVPNFLLYARKSKNNTFTQLMQREALNWTRQLNSWRAIRRRKKQKYTYDVYPFLASGNVFLKVQWRHQFSFSTEFVVILRLWRIFIVKRRTVKNTRRVMLMNMEYVHLNLHHWSQMDF